MIYLIAAILLLALFAFTGVCALIGWVFAALYGVLDPED